MKTLVLVALLAIAATTAFRPCPAGGLLSSRRDKCYHIIPVALNTRSARQTCANFGANLASVTTARDNEVIQEAAAFLSVNLHLKQKKFWLGGNDEEGFWAWDDESPFTFTNWAANQPNPTGHCLQIDSATGRWSSGKCNEVFPYVCETEPVSPCADPDGWQSFGDHHYLYYTKEQKTWSQAEDYCKYKGAHLASVHSKEESDFIRKVMYPMTPDTHRLEAWIGGQRVGNTTQFAWSDGSLWNYNNWKYSPVSGFNCVELSHANGASSAAPVQGWTASYCDHPFHFICKKPIDDYVAMKLNKEEFFRNVYKHYFV
ncbi:hypothetical protein QR680_018616 [Steinernema hermaphroditum]|uniref:C-type lectin domain-containing protein n=1 Tax=Steinernema hermaphroditum TaxID=289476 RepID=A0AA39HIH8_9BILA|nr:hypothetical protein QR680_018616 [Steinernema hermaphroditum]